MLTHMRWASHILTIMKKSISLSVCQCTRLPIITICRTRSSHTTSINFCKTNNLAIYKDTETRREGIPLMSMAAIIAIMNTIVI